MNGDSAWMIITSEASIGIRIKIEAETKKE